MEPMKWNDSASPDLTSLSIADWRWCLALIKRYGEIRFRYAAVLTEHMVRYGSSSQWLHLIQAALEGNWMSAMGMELLAELRLRDKDVLRVNFQIPWLNRYSARADEIEFCEIISLTSMRCAIDPKSIFAFLDEPNDIDGSIDADNWHNELLSSGLGKASLRLVPDLRFDNVVLWLHYLASGDRDPQLRRCFEKYRPDQRVDDYAAIKKALLLLTQSNVECEEDEATEDDFPDLGPSA